MRIHDLCAKSEAEFGAKFDMVNRCHDVGTVSSVKGLGICGKYSANCNCHISDHGWLENKY